MENMHSLCSVKEEILSDGSKVYNVLVGETTICCYTEKDAWSLFEAINVHAVGIE